MKRLLWQAVVLILLALAVHGSRRPLHLTFREHPGVLLTLCISLFGVAVFSWAETRSARNRQRRGVRERDFSSIRHSQATGTNDMKQSSTIFFGGVHLPAEAAVSHFMLAGGTGSGKTLNLRMMLKSVVPQLLYQKDQRAVVFDVKQDMLSILGGIINEHLTGAGASPREINAYLQDRVIIANPFDSRCWEWDIAADVTTEEVSLQIATVLIPEEQGPNRYFTDAARDVLGAVQNVFIERAPGKWRFSDLLYTMRSADRIRYILSATEEGREISALHLDGGPTTKSVISTARSRLAPFAVPAALWRHAGARGRTFTLRDYLVSNRILLLGNNQAALAPMQAINRLIFQRLTELILDQSESETRRSWFFLDEVRKLGKLEGLDDLMTNGRSKGASVFLGFQDIDGMRAVYGREIAGEITSMCGSFGVLRVGGASTPQWASDIFGEQEVIQTVRGYTHSNSLSSDNRSSNTSHTEQIRERRLYLPSEFRLLPRPQKGQPLHGYFCSIFAESLPYRAEIKPSEVDRMLAPKLPDEVNFVPWGPTVSRKLPAWTVDDYRRLGIRPMPPGAIPVTEPVVEREQGFIDPGYAQES